MNIDPVSDYLTRIRNAVAAGHRTVEIPSSNLKKEFDYLSYVYDYSWYGEFTIDKVAFEKAEMRFNKTLNTL